MASTGSYPDATLRHPRPASSRPHCRVEDVMTTPAVSVDRITPYKEIARLLAEHRISGLPVLTMGWQVVGVVSEADLLAAQSKAARRARTDTPGGWRWLTRGRRHTSLTAGELMTSPAITIDCAASLPAAARAMTAHHVRRLPVTGADNQLIGIVSRRDLLSVFLRPDADITGDVRDVLEEIPLDDPAAVIVIVRHGVVTLTGTIEPAAGRPEDLIQLAMRRIWDLNGVVDIVTRLTEARGPKPASDAQDANLR
jgi:CBS domain-containing protein